MLWVARVLLNPVIRFQAGREPDASVFDGLHHAAHSQCFIANSVRTEIVVSATAVKRQA
jgi:organic hydroperoxide reductase OsmC/OhrA